MAPLEWTYDRHRDFERMLQYTYKNQDLAWHSMVHSSYANEAAASGLKSNERMEFIGDAILDFVIGVKLYSDFPNWSEGKLSKIRARIVCESALVAASKLLGLGGFLLVGKGEEQTNGRNRPSILADALEAVIGSLYLDAGMDAAEAFTLRVLSPAFEAALQEKKALDYKSLLQEELQQRGTVDILYKMMESFGPDHAKTFRMMVSVDGKLLGSGLGRTKKDAEQEAAREALEVIRPTES